MIYVEAPPTYYVCLKCADGSRVPPPDDDTDPPVCPECGRLGLIPIWDEHDDPPEAA